MLPRYVHITYRVIPTLCLMGVWIWQVEHRNYMGKFRYRESKNNQKKIKEVIKDIELVDGCGWVVCVC